MWDNETPLDPALHEAARHFNSEPPPFRSDVVWERIQAERRQRSRQAPMFPVRWRGHSEGLRPGLWIWPAAAAALLVLGIGLGRLSMREEVAAPVAVRAEQPAPIPRPRGFGVPAQPGTPLRVATAEHLGSAEALLIAFRSNPEGAPNGDVAAWAEELLGTTRLLLDAPGASDPELQRLLEDLELVLAGIASLRAAADTMERELVERSLERGDLLPRLRTAVPAGPGAARI